MSAFVRTHRLALVAVVALTAPAFAQAPKGLPAGTTVEKDVSYGPHERNKLDVFVPKSDAPLPLIIWVHGGGWEGGSKESNPVIPLLGKGFAVASINYRYSKQAPFPAQIHDCKAAVRFLRANAKKYNLDPDRFGAWGASAGGHLVALLGTTGDVKELEGDVGTKGVSSRVQAVCDWFGPTDLIKLSPPVAQNNPVTRLLGGDTGEKAALAKQANPITHCTKDSCPFLILHGDKDTLVPVSQSELLHEALKKCGVASTLIVVAGAGHSGAVAGNGNSDKIAAFFERHLKTTK